MFEMLLLFTFGQCMSTVQNTLSNPVYLLSLPFPPTFRMSYAWFCRKCEAKKLGRNVNTCTYSLDKINSNTLCEEYSEEGVCNATLEIGTFPCFMNTGAEAPDSSARSLENSVPTQSVPGKTDNLINQLNNISNVLYSKDVSEEYPKHLDNIKNRENI